MAALVLAALAGACASIDDSGPVRSIWRPADGKPAYLGVVYVTDRKADANAPGGFGPNWADQASCGVAEAVVPAAQLPGEEPKYGHIAKTWPRDCATDKGPLAGAVAEIKVQAEKRNCQSVFLFVHGFHSSFDSAVLRAAQVGHDAQTGCAIAAFGWSSESKLDRYAADIEHSVYSQPFLAELLRELADSGLRVTILAHSSGARMVLATLSSFAHSRFPVRESFIDELALVAADVGSEKTDDDFSHLLTDAAPYARRTTIYASKMDGVLLASEYAHGDIPRAGREPAANLAYRASGGSHIIDVIDASQPPADLLDHSYFAMSYETVADLTLTLDGVSTADRLTIKDGWQPTLTCANAEACAGDPRYALAVATDRHPRLITRIILNLLPLIPFAR